MWVSSVSIVSRSQTQVVYKEHVFLSKFELHICSDIIIQHIKTQNPLKVDKCLDKTTKLNKNVSLSWVSPILRIVSGTSGRKKNISKPAPKRPNINYFTVLLVPL